MADYSGYLYAPGSGLPLIQVKTQAFNAVTGVLLATVYSDSTGKWDFGALSVIPTIYAYTEFGIRLVLRGEIVGTIGANVDVVSGGAFRANATAILTGDGFYTAYNAGVPVLRIGTVSGGALVKGVYWDGSNLAWIGVNTSLTAAGLFTATNAVITGTITASLGAIGGWVIGATSLMDAAGVVGMSSAVTAGDDIRFWAGHATPGSAPFRVTEAGALVATSATITGAITASSGSVGSFTIGTYLYTGTKTAYNDANAGVHLGSDGLGIGNNVFTVSSAGALVATSATITGAITATSGTIAGFTVDATEGLYAGSGVTRVQMKPGAGFWAGATAQASAPFSVTQAGALTATSGTVGGWTISATLLLAGAGATTVWIYTGSDRPTFSAGDANPDVAPFRVWSSGALVATSATITGSITSTSGTIGGFTLSASALYAGSVATRIQLDTSSGIHLGATAFADAPFRVSLAGALVATSATITGTLTMTGGSASLGTGNTILKFDTTNGLWLGNATFASAPFSVSLAGALVATSATITGAITATSGSLGGWTIAASLVKDTGVDATSAGLSPGSGWPFFAGATLANRASAPFRVTQAGALVATSATITGAITATSGGIGGWVINANYLYKTNTGLAPDDYPFFAGSTYANRATASFRVTPAGALTATSATITGSITASSGSFTGVLSIGASGGIFQGTGTFAAPTTALKIYNSGGIGLLEMWGAGVKQVYFGTDGKLYAGAGAVKLDNTGLTFSQGSGDANRISWWNATPSQVGFLGVAQVAGEYVTGDFEVIARQATENAQINIVAQANIGLDFQTGSIWIFQHASILANSFIAFMLNQNDMAKVTSAGFEVYGTLKTNNYIQTGATPALSGQVRLPNNAWIAARNAAGGADVNMIRVDTSDQVVFGTTHGADQHTDRTGYIIPLTCVIGTYATDSIGDSHLDLADGGTNYTYWEGYIPLEFVSATVTVFARLLQHAVGAGNVRIEWAASVTRSAATAGAMGVTAQTVAAPGTVNTVFTDQSQALTTTPQSGDRVSVRFGRLGADAADTYAGVLGVIGMWMTCTVDE